jgi:hypothetical protein
VKYSLIKYRFKDGSRETWHRDVAEFIAALDSDPDLKGEDIVSLHEEPRRQ